MASDWTEVDSFADASGKQVTIAYAAGLTRIAVDGGGPVLCAITLGAQEHDRFDKAHFEAARQAEASRRAEERMPEPGVMKIVRENFFTANPGASQDDWRHYCGLIGPGVAEAYASPAQAQG